MTVNIENPELERLIAQYVASGTFASPADVVRAALSQFVINRADEDEELDGPTSIAVADSMAQAGRGETLTLQDAARRLGITITAK